MLFLLFNSPYPFPLILCLLPYELYKLPKKILSKICKKYILGRVFFGWVADRRYVSALAINNFSLIACGILTLACPLLPNFTALAGYASLFGFIICRNKIDSILIRIIFIAAYICLTSIVLADLLGLELLTSSFGLLVVARGISALAGSPFAGIF